MSSKDKPAPVSSQSIPADLFQKTRCPICGNDEFDVLKPSKYPANLTAEMLLKSYSASSSHMLFDQLVQCRKCTMQYLNPRPNDEIVLQSYSEAVDPTFVAQNPNRIATFTKTLRKVLGDLQWPDGQGRRYLDIGCAGGASLVAARSLGFSVQGVEPSHWLADFGRTNYGIDVRDGILKPGMFPEASYDLITMWDVLEHIPEPGPVLDLIRTLLKPGGVLLLTYPDINCLAPRLLGDRWPFWLSVHLNYYVPATIRLQVEQANFEVLRFRPYWMSLPLGYTLSRAVPYFKPIAILQKLVEGLGLGNVSFTYNIGQTLVLNRKKN